MNEVIIDLGCGSRKITGAIGVDGVYQPGVNVLCDFEQSIPLKSNSVDILYANHLLEHIQNLFQLMEEVSRVCKPGGQVYITVPYYMSSRAFHDPTHLQFISEDTFLYFQEPTYYGFKTNFEIQKICYKYRTIFRIFPGFLKNIFRKHLWNVVDEMYVTLKALDGPPQTNIT